MTGGVCAVLTMRDLAPDGLSGRMTKQTGELSTGAPCSVTCNSYSPGVGRGRGGGVAKDRGGVDDIT